MGIILRVQELLEDMTDLKAIEDRKDEPVEDYEDYSNKRKDNNDFPREASKRCL